MAGCKCVRLWIQNECNANANANANIYTTMYYYTLWQDVNMWGYEYKTNAMLMHSEEYKELNQHM